MKRTLAFATLAAALLLCGSCAKAPVTGKNDLAKRYFDAWTVVHYPDAPKTYFGSVIIRDVTGPGALIGSSEETPFVYCTYLATDLDGNILNFTDESVAKQLGTYSESAHYGPAVINRSEGRLEAGLIEMMQTMRVGGSRTAAIPGWLMATDHYETPAKYLENCSGTDAIWTFTIQEAIRDIVKWETDSLARYMARRHPGVDSTGLGYYYVRTAEPLDTTDFDSGSSVYVNYIGRLLNGQVFDTTVADTAKRYRIFQETKTYEPVQLSWPDGDGLVTFSTGSDAIPGFERCVHAMHAGEKGICIFYSGLGYGASGGGSSIPAYSPLIFEIQMLGVNEDGSID